MASQQSSLNGRPPASSSAVEGHRPRTGQRRGRRHLIIALFAGIALVSAGPSSLISASASSGSGTGGTQNVAVVSASLSSVTLNPTDVVGGSSSTGTVALTAAAPSGGFAVALSSDNTAAATVPASVTVLAGATTATFVVSTTVVPNSQSAIIIGTAGGVTAYGIITVRTAFASSNGSISILPGGIGSGTVTSQPAGISCTITGGSGAGACSAFYPVGTVVRLTAKAASGSSFQGFRGVGCGDPSKITIAAGTNITCQVGFALK